MPPKKEGLPLALSSDCQKREIGHGSHQNWASYWNKNCSVWLRECSTGRYYFRNHLQILHSHNNLLGPSATSRKVSHGPGTLRVKRSITFSKQTCVNQDGELVINVQANILSGSTTVLPFISDVLKKTFEVCPIQSDILLYNITVILYQITVKSGLTPPERYLAWRPFLTNHLPLTAEEELSAGHSELFRSTWLQLLISSLQKRAVEFALTMPCMYFHCSPF